MSTQPPPSTRSAIPRDGVGVGLRAAHYPALREGPVDLDFLEVLVDNYLGVSELPRLRLAEVGARYPLVAHGVALDLLGAGRLDARYLRRLRALVRRHAMPWATDHLCWTSSEGAAHHDLLPAPNTERLVPYAAARIRKVQAALGVPFGVENVSSYVAWEGDDLPEWVFLSRVAEAADCGLLLDVNNIWVSACNHGFDPVEYLRAIPWRRVLHVHLAGHRVRADGLLHDTHDQPVCDAVWRLYAEAWRLGGPFPTLVEWDADIPPLDVVVREARRAIEVRG